MVQGVFFRETVRRTASRYDVRGFVRNVGFDALEIEAEGEPTVVNSFIEEILARPPRGARIEEVRSTAVPPGAHRFFGQIDLIDASALASGL
jgi:acylphosphatase